MKGINTDLLTRVAGGGSVTRTSNGFHLAIPDGNARSYRVAQLDDYAQSARKDFPHRSSLRLSLHARASADSIPGTWGFGLWNDPFGLSLGFGGNPFRVPALPNAVWFFHASEENYLSFQRPSKGLRHRPCREHVGARRQAQPGGSGRKYPGNGFLAQTFRSPVFPLGRLARVGATFPFSRAKARELMGGVVEEDGVRLGVDVTEWHEYRFEWSAKQSAFWVDDVLVLETSVSPRPPLGLVIWIDNQFAAWHPDGKIGFGILENTEPAWLEIEGLILE